MADGFLFGACSECCEKPCSECECDITGGQYFEPSIAGMSAEEDNETQYRCEGDVDCAAVAQNGVGLDDANPCQAAGQPGAVVETFVRNGGTAIYFRREYGPCLDLGGGVFGRDPWVEYSVEVGNEGCDEEDWNFFIALAIGQQGIDGGCVGSFRVQARRGSDGCPTRIRQNSYGDPLPFSLNCPEDYPFQFLQPEIQFSPCINPDNEEPLP
jgi:hypothetical protein